jgi:monoamine oxidase
MGSYPFYPINYFHNDKIIQNVSLNRILFIGDYLIPGFAGYMEGAVRSAENALKQLLTLL